jgi:hypothetical protein
MPPSPMAKTKRCRKLTPEEKKRVWAKPESNAGAGWLTYRDHIMSIAEQQARQERD